MAHVRAFLCILNELLLMPQPYHPRRTAKDLSAAIASYVLVLTHARASATSGLEVAHMVAERWATP